MRKSLAILAATAPCLVWETDPSMRETEAEAAFADVWCAIPKVVFSRTLSRAPQGGARCRSVALGVAAAGRGGRRRGRARLGELAGGCDGKPHASDSLALHVAYLPVDRVAVEG